MKSQFRLGNLSIIGAFICDKEMRNSTNILILNLSLADLVVITFIEAFKLVGILECKKFFDQTPSFSTKAHFCVDLLLLSVLLHVELR